MGNLEIAIDRVLCGHKKIVKKIKACFYRILTLCEYFVRRLFIHNVVKQSLSVLAKFCDRLKKANSLNETRNKNTKNIHNRLTNVLDKNENIYCEFKTKIS